MTTQEDFTVKTNEESDAVSDTNVNEDTAEATNTQEDYDILKADHEKAIEERENYRRMALKYKTKVRSSEVNLDEEDDAYERTVRATKTFTADEVADIATKAAEKALTEERAKTGQIHNVNEELRRSLKGQPQANGMSSDTGVDTSKIDPVYFNDSQKAFLKTLDVTEEEVLATKKRRQNMFS